MAHPNHHAASSARKFGGVADDYIAIHQWFDVTKSHEALPVHRALRHHSFGCFDCEAVFGREIMNAAARQSAWGSSPAGSVSGRITPLTIHGTIGIPRSQSDTDGIRRGTTPRRTGGRRWPQARRSLASATGWRCRRSAWAMGRNHPSHP